MRLLFLLLLLAVSSPVAARSQMPDQLEAVVTTDLGTFRFEFAVDRAPKHVEQFIARARDGYYNGSAFHRVVANGMIQGGDPLLKNPKTARNLWGTGGLNLLPSEFSDFKHDRGVVSTVSLPNKADSDGSQFFICVVAQPVLDGHYSAFGRVTEGMDVVEKISRVPSDKDGVVDAPVRIVSVTIEPKKVEPFLNAPVSALRRTVTLKTTLGSIQVKMEPDWAPENVRTFLKLTATSGPTHPADRWVRPVKGEFHEDVKHVRGVVSMARGDDPNSATTSFFLLLDAAPHLDGQYSAFGRVIGGLDVLDAFEKEEVNGEAPKRRIDIIDASIDPE